MAPYVIVFIIFLSILGLVLNTKRAPLNNKFVWGWWNYFSMKNKNSICVVLTNSCHSPCPVFRRSKYIQNFSRVPPPNPYVVIKLWTLIQVVSHIVANRIRSSHNRFLCPSTQFITPTYYCNYSFSKILVFSSFVFLLHT